MKYYIDISGEICIAKENHYFGRHTNRCCYSHHNPHRASKSKQMQTQMRIVSNLSDSHLHPPQSKTSEEV